MNGLRTLLAVRLGAATLCLAALFACHTTMDFRSPAPALVATSAPLPVTLSNQLRKLRARASEAGEKATFKVGNLLSPLFASSDGHAFLNYVAADIAVTRDAAGWSTTYTLGVTLQYAGATHRIQGEGQGASPESLGSSGAAAIETCVEDVYGQVRTLLAAPPPLR